MNQFIEGQWVVNEAYDRVARVKDAYESEPLLDLVFYRRDGTKLGRESEPMGGPRGFEPACDASNWIPIKPPKFPLPRYGSLLGFVFLTNVTPPLTRCQAGRDEITPPAK